MWGIDFMDAVDEFSIYMAASSIKCIALDHLYWISDDGKEVDPPARVDGPLNCAHTNITSLVGSPKTIGRGFYCNHTHLKSLKYAPETVGGTFNCSQTEIESLQGAPQYVEKDFICSMNPSLESLYGAPREVGGSFDCENTSISSLDGAPSYIGASLYCRNGTHVSKEQAEEYIRNFHCSRYEAMNWKKAHIDQSGHYRELDANGKYREYK